MKFDYEFDSDPCPGDSITQDFEVDGVPVMVTARLEPDLEASVEDYDCYTDREVEAWKADRWHFAGVVLEASIEGFRQAHVSSLWGIDVCWAGDDYPPFQDGNGYLTDVANELLPEAIEEVRAFIHRIRSNAA